MLLREDKLRLAGEEGVGKHTYEDDKDYLGNDAFFTKNFRTNSTDKYSKYIM